MDIASEPRLVRPMPGGEADLNAALPNQLFVLQDELRMRAKALDQAANKPDDAALAVALGQLTQTCVACHSARTESVAAQTASGLGNRAQPLTADRAVARLAAAVRAARDLGERGVDLADLMMLFGRERAGRGPKHRAAVAQGFAGDLFQRLHAHESFMRRAAAAS